MKEGRKARASAGSWCDVIFIVGNTDLVFILALSSENPWNFLSAASDEGVVCYEVTFGMSLGPKHGGWSPPEPTILLTSPISIQEVTCASDQPATEGRGLDIAFNHPSRLRNEAAVRTQKDRVLRAPGG